MNKQGRCPEWASLCASQGRLIPKTSQYFVFLQFVSRVLLVERLICSAFFFFTSGFRILCFTFLMLPYSMLWENLAHKSGKYAPYSMFLNGLPMKTRNHVFTLTAIPTLGNVLQVLGEMYCSMGHIVFGHYGKCSLNPWKCIHTAGSLTAFLSEPENNLEVYEKCSPKI